MYSMIFYIDVDDTLIRSFGTKRIPMTPVIEHVRALHAAGATLYCWSTAGAEYARQSAGELGIEALFTAFLPKPEVIIDDQPPAQWRKTRHYYPSAAAGQDVGKYFER
jgi:hypothetical protein